MNKNTCQFYHPYLNCRAQVLLNATKKNYKGKKLSQMLENLGFDIDKCLECKKFKGRK